MGRNLKKEFNSDYYTIGLTTLKGSYSYIDENKNKSRFYDTVLNNQEEWRKSFWNRYETNKLVKTKDWEYEKEYRIVFNGLTDYEIDVALKVVFPQLKSK